MREWVSDLPNPTINLTPDGLSGKTAKWSNNPPGNSLSSIRLSAI